MGRCKSSDLAIDQEHQNQNQMMDYVTCFTDSRCLSVCLSVGLAHLDSSPPRYEIAHAAQATNLCLNTSQPNSISDIYVPVCVDTLAGLSTVAQAPRRSQLSALSSQLTAIKPI